MVQMAASLRRNIFHCNKKSVVLSIPFLGNKKLQAGNSYLLAVQESFVKSQLNMKAVHIL